MISFKSWNIFSTSASMRPVQVLSTSSTTAAASAPSRGRRPGSQPESEDQVRTRRSLALIMVTRDTWQRGHVCSSGGLPAYWSCLVCVGCCYPGPSIGAHHCSRRHQQRRKHPCSYGTDTETWWYSIDIEYCYLYLPLLIISLDLFNVCIKG